MSLGWHSSPGPRRKAPPTDPELLAALNAIAGKLDGIASLPAIADSLGDLVNSVDALTEAVKDLNTGTDPGDTLPECGVLDESGAYLVDESGNYIVHDCVAEGDPIVVDESGNWLVAENGAFVTYEAPKTITSDSGELVVNDAGLQLVSEVPA